MSGAIDTFDFLLAEKLGMSLGQVRELPNSEVTEWRSFWEFRAAMEELHSRGDR